MLFRLLLFIVIASALSLSAAQWTITASGPFELITDTSPSTARDAIRQLEGTRALFVKLTGNRQFSPLPVRIFLFSSGTDYNLYQVLPHATGYFHSGVERDYIVLRAGAPTTRVLTHELTHVLLAHSSLSAASWFSEGIAEFFSTAIVTNQQARVGSAPRERVEQLRRSALMPLSDLFKVTHSSPNTANSRAPHSCMRRVGH